MDPLPPGHSLQILFFDAAGTLFHLREPVGSGYARIGSEHGLEMDPEETETAFRQAWKAMPPPYPSREVEPERWWWRQLVEIVVSQSHGSLPPSTKFDPYFEALWEFYGTAEAWMLYPEVGDVLASLASQFRLGVISNFDQRLYPVLEGLGIAPHLDPVILSAEVGAAKPDPSIFKAALQQAKCPATAALHIGDEPKADWEGARKAGLLAWELDRKEHSLEPLLQLLTS